MGVFSGQVFVLVGTQDHPEDLLIATITKHGGKVQSQVTEQVSYIVSSDFMASVWGNTYKLQFFPEFESQVTSATVFSIPIVSGQFVFDCTQKQQLLDVADYLIFGRPAEQIETKSKLDPRVQELVRLLFDKAAQQQAMMELALDPSKITQVTQSHIKEAMSLLSEIERAIQLKAIKKSQDEAQKQLTQLSNRFYSLIPHTKSPVIDSQTLMKEKLSMLEGLTDIIIANSLMKDHRTGHYSVSPIDINYKKLKTQIVPLERWTQEFQLIQQFVENTHAKEHDYFSIELQDIFEVDREGEKERFKPFENLKHHRFLWHGSRLANFVGILSQGLRIAPPEAPVTGYFLGKGVYFADMVSKSAEYCHPTKENPYALMLLCEVALGRPFQVAHTKFVSKEDLEEAGYHSVKGCGLLGPDPAYDSHLNNVTIQLGREAASGVTRSELPHNEYVVYDVSQIRIRYLVKVKVNSSKQVKALSLVHAN